MKPAPRMEALECEWAGNQFVSLKARNLCTSCLDVVGRGISKMILRTNSNVVVRSERFLWRFKRKTGTTTIWGYARLSYALQASKGEWLYSIRDLWFLLFRVFGATLQMLGKTGILCWRHSLILDAMFIRNLLLTVKGRVQCKLVPRGFCWFAGEIFANNLIVRYAVLYGQPAAFVDPKQNVADGKKLLPEHYRHLTPDV